MNRTLVLTAVASLVLSIGCAKKTPPPVEPVAAKPAEAAPEPEKKEVPEPVAKMIANFNRVHFEFNKFDLPSDTRSALMENVEIMRKYTSLKLEIQGHADDRGTSEYNLALGDKRARAVVDYMVRAGLQRSRFTIVSYGEERPLQEGQTESAWGENRRAEFRVTWKPDEMAEIHGTTE